MGSVPDAKKTVWDETFCRECEHPYHLMIRVTDKNRDGLLIALLCQDCFAEEEIKAKWLTLRQTENAYYDWRKENCLRMSEQWYKNNPEYQKYPHYELFLKLIKEKP